MSETELRLFERQFPQTITVESEVFRATTYIIKDKNIIIDSAKCGRLAIAKENLQEFIEELQELKEVEHYFTERKGVVKNESKRAF